MHSHAAIGGPPHRGAETTASGLPPGQSEVVSVGETVFEAVTEQPEMVAVVVIAVAIAVFAVGYLWQYFGTTRGDRFVAALADRNKVAVLMHPNPDPDAMACAMAVVALARSVDTAAVVQYPGQIRHPENRAFETVLNCDFERIDRVTDLASAAVVLVDHNEPRGFHGAERLRPYAIVDHHPGNGEGTAFTDVRPQRGSCASIFADYLRELGWSNDPTDDGPTVTPTLATALLYGIQSDTTSFTRGCTTAEFDAAAYLFPAADSNALDRIANPQVDSETLDVKARAINERILDGSFLVSHVGQVSNLDSLPTAADELIRLEGVTVAVVTGQSDGTLHLSGRSQDDRVHMGKTIQAALKAVPDASAGGHARMGGGQAVIPATASSRETHPELQERLFAAMNGEL